MFLLKIFSIGNENLKSQSGTFFVLFAGIIAGTYLVQQNQDFREKAAPATTVYISPANQTKDVGNTFTFSVNMDTASNQVTGVDIRLKYNPSLIEVTSIQKGQGVTVLNTEINNSIDNNAGKISYAIFTVTKANAISGSGVEVLKVDGKIKNGASGTAAITFDSGTIISGVSEGQNVITGTTPANIMIAGALGPTSAPTLAPTSAPTQNATATSRATSNPSLQTTPTPTPLVTVKPTATSTTASNNVNNANNVNNVVYTQQPTNMPIPVTGSSMGVIVMWGIGIFSILASYLLLGY